MSTAISYYNEIDPNAAEWLRQLIKSGQIAPGDVDERRRLFFGMGRKDFKASKCKKNGFTTTKLILMLRNGLGN